MEYYEQPFNRQQREELEGLLAPSAYLFRAGLYVIFMLLAGSLFHALQRSLLPESPLWLVPTLLTGLWLYHRAGRWSGGGRLRRQIRRDLEMGQAVVRLIRPSRVEKLEPLEDEGPAFLVETQQGELCLFCGQQMEDYAAMGFPWAVIGVVETPCSGRLLGLERLGESIRVDATRAPFCYREARDLGCFRSTFVLLDERQRALLGETDSASRNHPK